jgi:hypothetical protein
MTSRVLSLSLDGLLEPIGHSQIVKLLLRLAARGLPCDVVSLERQQDLASAERLERTRRQLEDAGVRWLYGSYRKPGGPAVAFANVYRLRALAPDILREARERTRSHFDLEAGARRYEGLLRELLSGIRVSSPDTPEAH